MQPIHCTGTLKTGNLAGKPCRKFLGNLTVPYADVLCSRCGHKNLANLEPGTVYEWSDEPPDYWHRLIYIPTLHPVALLDETPFTDITIRFVLLKCQEWRAENGTIRWAWVIQPNERSGPRDGPNSPQAQQAP